MIIFKTYTPGSVRNSQTISNNFSNVYFRLFSRSVSNKNFVISQKASMSFFEGCTHDYFQSIHLGKCLKQLNDFKEFFEGVYFRPFSEFAPNKIFVII